MVRGQVLGRQALSRRLSWGRGGRQTPLPASPLGKGEELWSAGRCWGGKPSPGLSPGKGEELWDESGWGGGDLSPRLSPGKGEGLWVGRVLRHSSFVIRHSSFVIRQVVEDDDEDEVQGGGWLIMTRESVSSTV